MDPEFLPGHELARQFYAHAVRPLLDRHQPDLRHSAALLGWGSDVLGFDSVRSTDHNWGPRCLLFVGPADRARIAEIDAMLAARLPETFLGWPVRFADVTAPGFPLRHWVEVAEVGDWLSGRLGFDPRSGAGLLDWLATPTQVLAEMTSGAVFHDGLAPGLAAARQVLTWYPDDIWRYVLACQWARISQEEAFPGRCAEAGDELGSAVVTARLVRDIMRLVLLMHRRYPTYSKWLGTSFAALPAAQALRPILSGAMTAATWADREPRLCAAYEAVVRMHNDLALTAPVDPATRRFFERPYRVIDAGRVVSALRESIAAADIGRLPLTGAVDQFVDSTDALADTGRLRSAVRAQLGQD